MKLVFVRHGETKGNKERRYVGRTDEPLLPESFEKLRLSEDFPEVQLVITSPMLRCRQTAEALYPQIETWVWQGLEEMDFGDFEYRNYQELSGNPDYQRYIDSGGRISFPNGEEPEAFRKRCVKSFEETLREAQKRGMEAVAFVLHGGSIMSILEVYGEPHRSYFEWQIKNGQKIEGEYTKEGKIIIT